MIIVDKMLINDYEKIKDNLENDFDEFWNANILKSELESENSTYVVAKEDNEIVGFAGIIIMPDTTEVTNIVTRKDQRKKGIGKILLDKLIEITKSLEKENISLEVNELNSVAIHLYEKAGFEKVGLRKKYYNGKNDAIIMTKNL